MSRSNKSARRFQSDRIKKSLPIVAAAGAALLNAHSALAVNYTWINLVGGNASGSWGNPANWDAAGGATSTAADAAFFNTLDITVDSVITLDGPRATGTNFTWIDTNEATPANYILNGTAASPSDPASVLDLHNSGGGGTGNETLTVGSNSPFIRSTMTLTINARLANPGGAGAFLKLGYGTLALTGDNSGYNGNIIHRNGVLHFDFNNSWSPAENIVSTNTNLQLQGGLFRLTGKANNASTQTFDNGTGLAYGASKIVVASTGTGSANLNLGGLTRNAVANAQVGGIVDITLPANGAVTFTDGLPGLPGMSTGAVTGDGRPISDSNGSVFVTVNGQSDWGADSGGGNIVAASSIGGFYTAATPATLTDDTNADVTSSGTLPGGVAVRSIRFAGAGASNVDLGTNGLSTPGILTTAGSGSVTISNGALSSTAGALGDLFIVHNSPNKMTISADITNSGGGTTNLVTSGGGTIEFTGNNSYSGASIIHEGTAVVSAGTFGFRETGGNETNIELAPGFHQTAHMIVSGGQVNTDRMIIAGNTANTAGGAATLTQTGGEINGGQWFAVGNHGNGTYNLSGGTLNVGVNGNFPMEVSLFNNNRSAVNMTGGHMNFWNNGGIVIGSAGASGMGTFNHNGGTVSFYSDAGTTLGGGGLILVGGSNGTHTYNLNPGATLNFNGFTHGGGAQSFGVVNLNGGYMRKFSGSPLFANFNGANDAVRVQAGGAIIDTNGFSTSIDASLTHDPALGATPDGGLTKLGLGTLRMTGAPSTYTGPTIISGGTIQLALGGMSAQVASYGFDGLADGPLAHNVPVANVGGAGAVFDGFVNNNDNITGGGNAGITVIPDGKFGKGVRFDGNGSSVDVASRIVDQSGSPGVWTLNVWVRNPRGGSSILGKNTGAAGPTTGGPSGAAWAAGFSQYYLSNLLPAGLGATGAPPADAGEPNAVETDLAYDGTYPVIVRHSGDFAGVATQIPQNDNTWHMLTIVGSGEDEPGEDGADTREYFYIDGVLQAEHRQNFNNLDNSSYSRIGKRIAFLGDGARNFFGDMDEFSLFPIALTPGQITELFNTNAITGLPNVPNPTGALPTGTAVQITAAGAALDLNGSHQTVGSLAGVPGSNVYLPFGSRLTTGGDNSSTTFAGVASGSGGITKTGSGTLTLTGANTYTGETVVQGGTLKLGPAAHATVLTGGGADLQGSQLVFDYSTGPNPAATVLGILDAGFDANFATGKIRSTTAVANSIGLGWKDDAANMLVTVKRTYYGDADLNGQVDVADLGILASNWQTAGNWGTADFDYSGFIDVNDLGLLASNWQAGVGSPLGPSFAEALASIGLGNVAVPEPASLGLLGLGIGLAARRRHRRG